MLVILHASAAAAGTTTFEVLQLKGCVCAHVCVPFQQHVCIEFSQSHAASIRASWEPYMSRSASGSRDRENHCWPLLVLKEEPEGSRMHLLSEAYRISQSRCNLICIASDLQCMCGA